MYRSGRGVEDAELVGGFEGTDLVVEVVGTDVCVCVRGGMTLLWALRIQSSWRGGGPDIVGEFEGTGLVGSV